MKVCTAHWLREFVEPDLNHFRQLARASSPAAALHATAGDPERSPRYRWFIRPLGFADDLRAVFRVGDTPWAVTTLWRRDGRAPFSVAEADLVAGLSGPIGDALRRVVRDEFAAKATTAGTGPGLLMFDKRDRLVSVNEHVAAWLDELPQQELVPTRSACTYRCGCWSRRFARESLMVGGDGIALTRARSKNGHWLVGQASATRDASGAPAGAVVTIETATPALLTPVGVEAYGLTRREQEIAGLLARGTGTDDIATTLFLSPHTVRDHVKSILAKVGCPAAGNWSPSCTPNYEPAHFAGVGRQQSAGPA